MNRNQILNVLQDEYKLQSFIYKLKEMDEDSPELQSLCQSFGNFHLTQTPRGIDQVDILSHTFGFAFRIASLPVLSRVSKAWNFAAKQTKLNMDVPDCILRENETVLRSWLPRFKELYLNYTESEVEKNEGISNYMTNLRTLKIFNSDNVTSPNFVHLVNRLVENSANTLLDLYFPQSFVPTYLPEFSNLVSIDIESPKIRELDFLFANLKSYSGKKVTIYLRSIRPGQLLDHIAQHHTPHVAGIVLNSSNGHLLNNFSPKNVVICAGMTYSNKNIKNYDIITQKPNFDNALDISQIESLTLACYDTIGRNQVPMSMEQFLNQFLNLKRLFVTPGYEKINAPLTISYPSEYLQNRGITLHACQGGEFADLYYENIISDLPGNICLKIGKFERTGSFLHWNPRLCQTFSF